MHVIVIFSDFIKNYCKGDDVAMKKTLSVIMAVVMIFSLTTIFAFGNEEDQSITVDKTSDGILIENTTKGDVFIPNEDIDSTMAISEETASNIAKLFIRDIILSQDTNWNVSTAVENVTPLYASNESTVNAYSVELNEGYIVVSAFLDVPSLILEWSDSAEPLYENLDCSNKILYMGGYNYFEGLSNNKVTDLYGKTISDDDLYDIFYNSRDINYIPDNVLVFIADKYASNSN